MRVLLLKVSSLGDVVHTLVAVNDAANARPGIQFDWVIDEAYTDIAKWHPAVDRVVSFPHRRWRRQLGAAIFKGEFFRFIGELRDERYDVILDAQGQVNKTMWLALAAHGRRHGMNWDSAREPLASLGYQSKLNVPKGQHAVERLRQLFAQSIGYALPAETGDYGIDRERRFNVVIQPKRLMFLHGTSWITKEWPEEYWTELVQIAGREDYEVQLTWGNQLEKQRAERLARDQTHVRVLDQLGINELATEIASCAGVVATDTGLGHVAAALSIPTVSVYGATSSGLTGAYGRSQKYIQSELECAPCLKKQCTYTGRSDVTPACFRDIPPARVWEALMEVMSASR